LTRADERVSLKHERQRNAVVFYSQGLYFLGNFSMLLAVLWTADGMKLLALDLFSLYIYIYIYIFRA